MNMTSGFTIVFSIFTVYNITFMLTALSAEDKIGLQGNLDSNRKILHQKIDGRSTYFAKFGKHDLAKIWKKKLFEFINIYENVLKIAFKKVPQIYYNADALLKKITIFTTNVMDVVSNTSIDTGEMLANKILITSVRQIKEIKDDIQKFADNVEDRFGWTINQLNETLINNTSEYDLWTVKFKQSLRQVNNIKFFKDRCRRIEDILRRSTHELQECCKITIKPMKTLCQDVTSFLRDVLEDLVEEIDQMQSCLEDKNSYRDYLLSCLALAFDNIASMIVKASQIKYMVYNILPIKVIYTRSCIAVVMVDMKYKQNLID